MNVMKKVLILGLLTLLSPIVLPVEPVHAARMSNEKQAVITHQYSLMKDADKIVILQRSGQNQTVTNPDQIRQIVQFFQQRQFQWHQPWLSNSAPTGSYGLEFYLVNAPLVKMGVAERSVNFRNNGQSFQCNLTESEIQQLTRLVQGASW